MQKTLLIGPLPLPLNGQSKCFQTLASAHENHVIVDRNVAQFDLVRRVLKYGMALLKSLYYSLFRNIKIIYISISRNWLGLVFDSIIILIGSFTGKKVVLHLHGNDFLINKYQRQIFAKTHSKCSMFIALSDKMKARIEKILSCPVVTLTNPIDDTLFEYESKHQNDHINIVFLSHVMKSKGIMDFISIAREMRTNSTLRFHVVGEMLPDHLTSAQKISQSVNEAVSELPNLIYHGGLYERKLIEFLTEMDILIFPSFYPVEALPLSVLECAAMGIYPIINQHNDLGEFSNLLEHSIITNTKNTRHVTELIQSLSRQDLLKFGIDNRKRCKQYSSRHYIAQFKDMIEK